MKVGFAALYDARDINRGSGTFYHLTCEIERQGHEVTYFSADLKPNPLATRLFRFASRTMGKKYRTFQDPFMARRIGKKLSHLMKANQCDILLTNDYGMAGYVETNKPIFLYTDAVFPFNYATNDHPWLANLSWFGAKSCQIVTRRGLHGSSFCFFPTAWAAKEAQKYGISDDKLGIIPFGANLEDPGRCPASLRRLARIKQRGVLNLLFVGKDWLLKGGRIAIHTADELTRKGVACVLHLVGCTPPAEARREYVVAHGFLAPSDQRQRQQLDALYREADFLVFPSICEGFGITAAEAAAYGLPVLGYRTRGVSEAVRNGETGVLLELGMDGGAFAERICSMLSNASEYERLATSARHYYEQTVNWSASAAQLLLGIKQHVGRN
jgi:glycosyltransferase involved in cell wall biosynthesis